jgi:Tfp pilus assembly protein PilW
MPLTIGRRRVSRDAGVTLIELVIAMSMTTLIGAMALTWFLGSRTANTTTVDANVTTASARNVLESWSWYLRLAHAADDASSAVTALDATSIQFTADLGALPSCTSTCTTEPTTAVTFKLQNAATGKQSLVRTTSPGGSSVVLTGEVQTGGCLFTALDADGNSLGCQNVDPTQIRGVELSFTAVTDSGRSQAFQTAAMFAASGSTS